MNFSALFAILLSGLTTGLASDRIHFPLLMPDVQPLQVCDTLFDMFTPKHVFFLQDETYFCTAFKSPRTEHEYIG